MDREQLETVFNRIKGKTIALVYIFEGDNSSGFEHFFIWKSNVITKWLSAIQELHCLPLILDVRTFVDKAINNTLPHIDFVLNLNSGTYDLSSMALVPSVCSAIGTPCIPCNAVTIVTGENKYLSNLIADSIGIKTPKNIEPENKDGIFRPINLGNSLGVKRGASHTYNEGVYQEFIPGYDITTPAVYNAVTEQMELMPSIIYLPESKDLNWFNGEHEKLTRQGYKMAPINLDALTVQKYNELIGALSIKTFCRIDARVHCTESGFYHNAANSEVSFDNVYFIEINVMPTIRDNNNFHFSFDSIDADNLFYECVEALRQLVGNVNLNSFLLASSMMSYIKQPIGRKATDRSSKD